MNETEELEGYLLYTIQPGERLVTEARLLVYPGMKEKALWQQRTYALIKNYGRKELRAEIENIHKRMFSEKKFETFRKKILFIFKGKV
jgi:hypothetical protein